MIVINSEYKLTKNFKELIDFFNELEQWLNSPNCSEEDKKKILLSAEHDLIMWGKI